MSGFGLDNDAVHWYMSELTSRIVTESGNPKDRYHLGKLILQGLKDYPDSVLQIDGATGKSITNREVLEQSVRCAVSFQNMGLKTGDIIVLSAPSVLELNGPFYAALYLGLIIAPIDMFSSVYEYQKTFENINPKLILCYSGNVSQIDKAVEGLNFKTDILTFDKSTKLQLHEFLTKYGDDTLNLNKFRAFNLEDEDTNAIFMPTSGSTGVPKSVVSTHKNLTIAYPYWWSRYLQFPRPSRLLLCTSPIQWISAIFAYLASPVLLFPRLQTTAQCTVEHYSHLINTYKPSTAVMSPIALAGILKSDVQCDFTCFEMILTAGCAVPNSLFGDLKKVSPNTELVNFYGMTELNGLGFHGDFSTPRSCGKPVGHLLYRLVNPDTQEDVLEPNQTGELWLKGPTVFKEYYKNPEATAETFAEGRWLKSGDLFYRDDNWNYFFVERLTMLIMYQDVRFSPFEIEDVIRQHPEVMEVAVSCVSKNDLDELPVACIVRSSINVTAQEIKDLVKNNLPDEKQLRGGVVFMSELPLTATSKINRKKLKTIVQSARRE